MNGDKKKTVGALVGAEVGTEEHQMMIARKLLGNKLKQTPKLMLKKRFKSNMPEDYTFKGARYNLGKD